MDLHLAGEDDLVERACPDAVDGARDGVLVVLGRHRARDPRGDGRIGVQVGQRRLGQARHARLEAGQELLGVVVGLRDGRERQAHVAAPARQRDAGHVQRRGRVALPVRRRAAVGGEGEASDGDRPAAARAVGRVADGPGGQRAPAARHRREAVGPAGVQGRCRAQRGQRGPVAVGLLQAEPRLARTPRRDGHRGGVDVARHRHRDRGHHAPLPRATGLAHGGLQMAAQPSTVMRREAQARAAGGRRRHRPESKGLLSPGSGNRGTATGVPPVEPSTRDHHRPRRRCSRQPSSVPEEARRAPHRPVPLRRGRRRDRGARRARRRLRRPPV